MDAREIVIGERTYRATQLPAMRALKLVARIGRVAGPAMVNAEAGDMDSAARALFDRLTEDEVEQIVRGLLETVTVENKSVMAGFDAAFMGKLDEVFLLVKFALEVQFGNFFGAVVAARGGAAASPST